MFQVIKSIFFKEQIQKLSIYGFGQLFNLVTPLIIAPYIISVCGEENYGKSAVGMALAFFLIVFVDFGSEISGVREAAVNREDSKVLNKIFSVTYSVKLIILVVILFLSSIIFFYFEYFKQEKSLFFFSLTILVGQFLNPTWFLQGVENVKYITFLNILSKIFFLICVFLFVKKEADYIYINFYWGLGMILANVFVLYLLTKKYNFSLEIQKWDKLKSHFKKDFSIFSSQIFVSLQMYAPVFLVSYFGNNLLAGQYRIVEQIIVVFRTYILLFFNYTYPRVCYLLSLNFKKGIKAWLQFNGVNFLFVFLGMLVFFFFSKNIISYFTNEDLLHLSRLLKLATLIPILFAISVPLKQLILAFNYNRYYVFSTYFLSLSTLFLIVFLLDKFNIEGVFYSLILTEMLGIIFYLYKLIKEKKHGSNPSTKATS
ncbi:MAG: oligosaccharide flippase family protein [Flavobacteriaceae bacterium]|nr:oligosaccharide flippase family protein [Flavobacteriaceae bacterium]